MKNKKIILPRCSNLYKIDFLNKKISFYHSNSWIKLIELNTWKMSEYAREIEFEFHEDKIGGYIIIPKFYDVNGNLLKIGNR